MYYTNGSSITKTFHGVTFGPGETKEVFGIINDPKFVLSSIRQEPPKRDRREIVESDTVVELPKKTRRGRKSTKKESASELSAVVATAENDDPVQLSDSNLIEKDKVEEV